MEIWPGLATIGDSFPISQIDFGKTQFDSVGDGKQLKLWTF